jgi:hypothetical protein
VGKALRKPFTQRLDRTQVVSELIKTYVYGPISVESLRGSKYYVQLYCYSKYRRVFLKQSKCLRMFLNEVSSAGHAVKMFRCDGGKELAYE